MGVPRTIPAVLATSAYIIPVYHGTIIAAVTFSILKGIATIVLGPGNLPTNGYNGPNGYPPAANIATHSNFNIYGGINGSSGGPAGGQQVTLWGFTTATYFNGVVVSVIDCDPVAGSFRFYFNHADVASTADTGNTAACPQRHFRAVRLECDQALSTALIYVGDLNLSATQYMACLSLAGQLAIEVASENIPADRIFVLANGTASTNLVHVTLIY